ncbi:MAG: CoA transferase [Deltaproteobacteria bacterium]|nr:CoA transferase [Deltaproteobacteria bacterium]
MKALSAVRVLDLTHMLAGPYGAMLLADLGAEVIKVEPPKTGEGTRRLLENDLKNSLHGMGAYFLTLCRNKKSLTLDLQTEKGRSVFYDLVKISDVVYDNFRPGVLDRLKIDYDTLKGINPGIISCSCTGFGLTGPGRDRPAFDLVVQAMGGGVSITGERKRPPVRSGIPIGDMGGGVFSALGILAALVSRARTGKGQKVDVSMLDVQISLLNYMATMYFLSGEVPGPIGNEHFVHVPYGSFKTKDIYIILALVGDNFWKPFVEILEVDQLKDPKYAKRDGRWEDKEKIEAIVSKTLATRPGDEWLELFAQKGIPSGPINTFDRALADPQVLRRNMVVEVGHPLGGSVKQPGNPIKMSGTPGETFGPPPLLGQHTRQILEELLGYPGEKVEELQREGVI